MVTSMMWNIIGGGFWLWQAPDRLLSDPNTQENGLLLDLFMVASASPNKTAGDKYIPHH